MQHTSYTHETGRMETGNFPSPFTEGAKLPGAQWRMQNEGGSAFLLSCGHPSFTHVRYDQRRTGRQKVRPEAEPTRRASRAWATPPLPRTLSHTFTKLAHRASGLHRGHRCTIRQSQGVARSWAVARQRHGCTRKRGVNVGRHVGPLLATLECCNNVRLLQMVLFWTFRRRHQLEEFCDWWSRR